jgi:PAS domain-containing protein
VSPEAWKALLAAVDDAYTQSDADRERLDRALELSSQELENANSEMMAIFQAFPDPFFVLDADGTVLDTRGGSASELNLAPSAVIHRKIDEVFPGDAGSGPRWARCGPPARSAAWSSRSMRAAARGTTTNAACFRCAKATPS